MYDTPECFVDVLVSKIWVSDWIQPYVFFFESLWKLNRLSCIYKYQDYVSITLTLINSHFNDIKVWVFFEKFQK